MAYNYALLGAMDTLWFNQMILFNPSVLLSCPNSVPESVSDSFTTTTSSYQSSSFTSTDPAEEDYVLLDDSPLTLQMSIDSEYEERKTITEEVFMKTRPSRLKRIKSSPPSTSRKGSRSKRYSGSVLRLQKTMSCKSLAELEVEEVKGFMDLGFRFDTQNLCPRMMSVLPGLQRLGGAQNTEFLQQEMIDDEVIANNESADHDQVTANQTEKRSKPGGVIRRPYLSEAWLISRPDSPLLNLRIPRNSKTADMKKHLKFWAVTVASVLYQES